MNKMRYLGPQKYSVKIIEENLILAAVNNAKNPVIFDMFTKIGFSTIFHALTKKNSFKEARRYETLEKF